MQLTIKFHLSVILIPTISLSWGQVIPEIDQQAKEVHWELRRSNPIGILSRFDIMANIMFSPLDDLKHSQEQTPKIEPPVRTQEDLDAKIAEGKRVQKELDTDLKFRVESIPILLQIGRHIASEASKKYPEIYYEQGKPDAQQINSVTSGLIRFQIREGKLDGNRILMPEISVSTHLIIEGQAHPQVFTVYSRRTIIQDMSQVSEACRSLLSDFYSDYTAARSARLRN